jgi:hypothetical protein
MSDSLIARIDKLINPPKPVPHKMLDVPNLSGARGLEKSLRPDIDESVKHLQDGKDALTNTNAIGGDNSNVQTQNVNQNDANKTLRLSRLTDYLNNKYYMSPGKVGTGIGMKGGGISGDKAEFGQIYRMPEIETEETRQMGRTRGYETAARNKALTRQDLVLDEQRKRETDAWNAEMQRMYTSYLSVGIPEQKATVMIKLMDEHPTYGSFLGALFGSVAPSLATRLADQLSLEMYNAGQAKGLSTESMYKELYNLFSGLSAETTKETISATVEGWLKQREAR